MQRVRPYLRLMRMDKPIGIWLLFFPAAWGMLLAPAPLRWDLLALMLLGATITRAAGCILNDLTDRKLDAQVERTRTRPLASGEIPVRDAWVLLGVLACNALLLTLVLPKQVVWLALCAVPLIAAYPWMKRITFWPQAFLGLTFNFGALIGWAATGQPLGFAAWLLYAGCFFWTLGYDTLYAVQDMPDDASVGIRSTARRMGTGARLQWFTLACYGAALLLWLCACIRAGRYDLPVQLALIAVAIQMGWQAMQTGHLTPGSTRGGQLFRSNQWVGLCLLLGLLLSVGLRNLS
jgi:4-hydroxybenzoate polyprenyltransferase